MIGRPTQIAIKFSLPMVGEQVIRHELTFDGWIDLCVAADSSDPDKVAKALMESWDDWWSAWITNCPKGVKPRLLALQLYRPKAKPNEGQDPKLPVDQVG